MKTYTLATVVIALAMIHLGSCTMQFFEFGADSPYNVVLTTVEGDMGLLEKIKTVKLQVPYCFRVAYVKVGVSNWFSTPKVDFDFNSNIAVISYDVLANNLSQYNILAKGYRERNCN